MTDKPDQHEEICTFCYEVSGTGRSNLFYDLGLAGRPEEYILYESDHFAVMPCIGALTTWYVLLVSKRHVLSVGWLNSDETDDLRKVLAHVRRQLGELSGVDSIVFEHGSYDFRNKGGACYDHAHIHVVATEKDVVEFVHQVPETVTMRQVSDWITEAQRLVDEERMSYLALDDMRRQMVGVATGAKSQFFRRCLSTWLGAEDGEWDWLTYPQIDRVNGMIEQWPHVAQ